MPDKVCQDICDFGLGTLGIVTGSAANELGQANRTRDTPAPPQSTGGALSNGDRRENTMISVGGFSQSTTASADDYIREFADEWSQWLLYPLTFAFFAVPPKVRVVIRIAAAIAVWSSMAASGMAGNPWAVVFAGVALAAPEIVFATLYIPTFCILAIGYFLYALTVSILAISLCIAIALVALGGIVYVLALIANNL